MLNKEPSPERAKLGFKDEVLSSFRFLNDARFSPVEQEMTLIRYESPEVFVTVYHGRASFELGVEIGRLKEPNNKLTLYDIIAWAGVEKAERFGQHVAFQVSSREGIQEFVPKLAGGFYKRGCQEKTLFSLLRSGSFLTSSPCVAS